MTISAQEHAEAFEHASRVVREMAKPLPRAQVDLTALPSMTFIDPATHEKMARAEATAEVWAAALKCAANVLQAIADEYRSETRE